MKHLNLFARFAGITLLIIAMLALAGCYNDAPQPWSNNRDNTGGSQQNNDSNKTPETQLGATGGNQQGNNSDKVPNTQQVGAGGAQQNDAGGATQQDPNYKEGFAVNFKIPPGWRYNLEGSNSEDQLILDQPSSDGIKPYVMMDLYWVDNGDDAKAKGYAQKDHNERFSWVDDSTNKEYKPYYKEMEVNGTKIFLSSDINHYWGFPSWSEGIWFSRGGIVYHVALDDIVEKHLDSVKTIVESIKRKN